MLVEIKNILDNTQLAAVRSVLQQSKFIDGQLSAGSSAIQIKHNQELAGNNSNFEALNNVVMTQLVQNQLYLQTAFPARIALPIYARYTEGMQYGEHIDDPVMGAPQSKYRADIAITIFISEPSEYSGGELCIETSFGEQKVKLPAGHAILYPASSIHSVTPVISGERLVAVTWIQSLIRNPEQRMILSQLAEARERLDADSDQALLRNIDSSYANLFRMWAEV
jgi:PKHD-type hydroxylase